ncbi:IS630 family transposase [Xenorhabdus koppenhoeferi]|uniref:Transposase n=1 Tax=Xenorhabdus koppenhoeferi TaxID=351659 RepID=A0A1I7KGK0_9GAMM|nr:IS630 family transposase [Xenorhabdus koppenhoeferi]SFU96552.1 Transposase [Xenorhabdus koppenhoeferi]
MPIITSIPHDKCQKMKKLIHKTRDKDYARRLTALLLLNEGVTVTKVAKILHAARSSVNRWVKGFRLYGLEGWINTISAMCAPYRLRWVLIHLNPKIGADWYFKGQQKRIVTPGKNEKYYLAGCLNAQTKEVTYVKGEKKNSDLFIKMLDELNARHPHAETITLILDNYCIHKSHKVKNWLAQHGKFTLLFLPVYSPWLNKIERLWQSLHETVTRNHCCQFMWQLLNHVDVFLRSFSSQQKPGIQKMSGALL